MEKVYVIGHKNPDTDSVVSAIGYSYLLNKINDDSGLVYEPVRCGELNPQTKFILDKLNIKKDEIKYLEKAEENHKLILMDHNEPIQAIDGAEKATVVGIVDHHKIDTFSTAAPLMIYMKPVGSTSYLVYELFKVNNVDIPESIGKLLLSGMLTDTVITKSPTCTKEDVKAIELLSEELGIDYNQWGIEIFSSTGGLSTKTANEIISTDYKHFQSDGFKVGIGQCEIVDISEVKPLESSIIKELVKIAEEEKLDWCAVMITDIIQELSYLYTSGNSKIEPELSYEKVSENKYICPGLLSRKKQMVPELMRVLDVLKSS